MDDFLVVAHRGASGSSPENTLLAFRRALEVGATWLELDVHLSADNQLVVIHDFNLKRTTNGRGKVGEQSVEELRRLDAGQGEQIPLLDEVLALLEGRAALNIELKGDDTGAALATHLRQRQAMGKQIYRLLVSSLRVKELRDFTAGMPAIPIALVADRVDPETWSLATELGVWSLNLHKGCVDQAVMIRARQRQIRILAYTVNHIREFQRLRKLGVNGIFTDNPERFVSANQQLSEPDNSPA